MSRRGALTRQVTCLASSPIACAGARAMTSQGRPGPRSARRPARPPRRSHQGRLAGSGLKQSTRRSRDTHSTFWHHSTAAGGDGPSRPPADSAGWATVAAAAVPVAQTGPRAVPGHAARRPLRLSRQSGPRAMPAQIPSRLRAGRSERTAAGSQGFSGRLAGGAASAPPAAPSASIPPAGQAPGPRQHAASGPGPCP